MHKISLAIPDAELIQTSTHLIRSEAVRPFIPRRVPRIVADEPMVEEIALITADSVHYIEGCCLQALTWQRKRNRAYNTPNITSSPTLRTVCRKEARL